MDLFGNPTPSLKKKSFKLTLSASATGKDKKIKSEIYACVKSIEELKGELEKISTQIQQVKTIFHNTIGDTYSELETQWKTLLYRLLEHLKQVHLFYLWETELVYHLLYHEIECFKQFNLNTEVLQPIYTQLSHFEKTYKGYTEIQYKDIEIENIHSTSKESESASTLDIQQDVLNSSDSIIKFKKIYKSLLKQIHPDVLFVSTEESEIRIQELTRIWESKAYYQLLKFNHDVSPKAEVELNSDDLNLILLALNSEQAVLNAKLKHLKTSEDYIFYVKPFYNLSDHIINQNIEIYGQTLHQKHSEIHTLLNQLSTSSVFKSYLSLNRIPLSEQLNIKYLIEDLYHGS